MQVFEYETLESTNEQAKRLIADGTLHGSAYVLAREQTAGKGTQGRTWISPKDAGIYLSVVTCEVGAGPPSSTLFSLAAGVACAEALDKVAAVAVQLKPVNDLLVAGRKLGGILIETLIRSGNLAAVVTGVGINVRRARRILPSAPMQATCLEDCMQPDRFERLARSALVESIVAGIQTWGALAARADRQTIQRAWEQYKTPGAVFPRA